MCLPLQVTCLREGYRSVPLKNSYSEEIEMASLLVHLRKSYKVSLTQLIRQLHATAACFQ